MRLIDANKLMESLNPQESVWVGLVLSELIANTTTVKAIPIEWIEEWGWKNGMSESMSLRVMIDDWEKENEGCSK